jgi:hypothetical protein
MEKPNRKRNVQLCLPQPGPPIPTWSSLPEKWRKEVLTLMLEMLRQHARVNIEARGGRHE